MSDNRSPSTTGNPNSPELDASGFPPIPLAEVEAAAGVIAAEAHRTPVLVSSALDKLLGATVLCKAESRQRAGSFKFRGAYHRVARLPVDVRARGVVAVSSGNHGAAVALAAQLFDVPATIHVPHDAPPAKVARIEEAGGVVVRFDRSIGDREARPRAEAMQTGATFVHPFEDRDVMVGQGTAALELHGQVGDLDALLVPMSGGGLMAGCASAMSELSPACSLVGVEPSLAADTKRSLERGARVSIPQPSTIADGLAVTSPGRNTFSINSVLVERVITASEEEIVDAMRLVHDELDLIIEPSGAVGVAALLASAHDWQGKRVGVILSGGNIDRHSFERLTEL